MRQSIQDSETVTDRTNHLNVLSSFAFRLKKKVFLYFSIFLFFIEKLDGKNSDSTV